MSTNPVYAFFATPKSFGPLVLRLLLAAVFVLHGSERAFGWFASHPWAAALLAWSQDGALHFPAWIAVLVFLSAASLFVGFFTRLAAGVLVIVLVGQLWLVQSTLGPNACEYPAALLAMAFALVFLGGGRLSLDRAISSQLLPSIG